MRQVISCAVIVAILISAIGLLGCTTDSSDELASVEIEPTGTDTEVSREIAILAYRLVIAYMSDKTWGFFGATCDQWIETDYRWEPAMADQQSDGQVKLTFVRDPERILGPENLVFYVDVDSGEVKGDNLSETGRSGVAEGCDKW